VGYLLPTTVRTSADPKAALLRHLAERLRLVLRAAERERWDGLDEEQLRTISEQVIARHLAKQLTVLEAQEEGYTEVLAAPDGVFLARGPEESASEYRRSMLEHQAQEDARKRRRAAPRDERFVRRVDPADGAARTKPELHKLYGKRGFSPAQIDAYWDEQCKQVYPGDEPPAELVEELERAGESCEALLYFLRRRTPHLHTSMEQAPRGVPRHEPLLASATRALEGARLAEEVLGVTSGIEGHGSTGGATAEAEVVSISTLPSAGSCSMVRTEAASRHACVEEWVKVDDWDPVD